MGKSFDIGLERLTGMGVSEEKAPASDPSTSLRARSGRYKDAGRPFAAQGKQDTGAMGSTFYLETFGCQMNDHDSEKVAGVLLARGYRQVDGPEAAKVILYNTTAMD